ncbi:MAG TPA: ABC transporter ATP-binding protein [Candidatus Acidoferrales bacterium]|nr:ABC transporter ATP-binding protein [Candidatus Acidoferrales bacterium]
MENLLQIRGLRVRFRSAELRSHTAVDEISFDIAPGEALGLMGESGSGKSSVALALLGLLSAETTEISGSALFRSQELLGMRERAFREIRGAAISLVFQEPGISLSPVMRTGDQVAEVVHAHRRWNWKRCRTEAEQMLARVGLAPTERIFAAYPHQLSGGQRQRVALAQALACDPALLIADEPTASLDARSQAEFIALLRSLKEQAHISILLISHTPEIQASLADRLLVMKDGRIVEEGSFDELCRKASHEYTRLMLRRQRVKNVNFEGEPLYAEEQFVR